MLIMSLGFIGKVFANAFYTLPYLPIVEKYVFVSALTFAWLHENI